MHAAAALFNAASFGFAAVLESYVLRRRTRSPLHRTVLALLVAIALWTAGATWRHLAVTRPELLVAFGVQFLGVCLVPPLWLLLAARFSRLEFVEERPWHVAALLAPGMLLYGGYLTNERHGAFAEISLAGFSYGPLFWVMVSWGYLNVLGGVTLFLRRARWMVAQHERQRALLLAAVALVPLLASVSYLGGWVRWPFDPTPAAVGVSTALLFPLVLRLSLLDNLPLVRRDVIEHLSDGVVIAGPDGAILDANPAAVRALGASVRVVRGASLDAVLAAITRPEDEALLRAALAPGAPSAAFVLGTQSGRFVRVRALGVAGRGGEPAGRFVVLHDCTEERRNEQLLRQAQKLESLGLLAAGIAHEVNNPLAFVRANLRQVAAAAEQARALVAAAPPERAEELADLAELPEIVGEAADGVERIARIVASMRRLARPGSAPEDAELDVNAALREALKLAQLEGGPELEVQLAPSLPLLRGSKDGLTQVFLNLLVNARQALDGRPDARLRVITAPCEGVVEVVIQDNGPGIAPEHQERVFDPFFTTKAPDEGTGLGLPIAFDLVRAHRGTLALESRPGAGARFTIRLPLSD